jgi:hypothetical protein
MKCGSRASFLARTFANLCLGCKPKVKASRLKIIKNLKIEKITDPQSKRGQ